MTVLVIAEHDNASIKPATLNTVTAAAQCGGDVHVLIAGHNAGEAAKAAAAIAGVATEMTARLLAIRDRLKATFAVVSVGGVMTEGDIDHRLAMGADLVMSATAAMWDPLLALRWKSRQG